MKLQDLLINKLTKDSYKIIFCDYQDIRIYHTIEFLLINKLVKEVYIVGESSIITEHMKSLNLTFDNIIIVDMYSHQYQKSAIDLLFKLREHKGMTYKDAEMLVQQNALVLSALLLRMNIVDAMVTGSYYTSGEVVRTGIQIIGLQKNLKTVSGSFLLEKDSEQLIFGDCAVNIKPTSDQLADIAVATAQMYEKLTSKKAKVALLSFSTYGSAKHDCVDIVRDVKKKLESRAVEFEYDGEMQFDAAYAPLIRAHKAPESLFTDKANCYIFPNLDSGNIGYKIAQHLGNFMAFGPLLQGLNQPYNDLSRGASVQDIIITSLITLSQVQK